MKKITSQRWHPFFGISNSLLITIKCVKIVDRFQYVEHRNDFLPRIQTKSYRCKVKAPYPR